MPEVQFLLFGGYFFFNYWSKIYNINHKSYHFNPFWEYHSMVLITFIMALYFQKTSTASNRNSQEVPGGLEGKDLTFHGCGCGCGCGCGMGSVPGLRTFMSVAKNK